MVAFSPLPKNNLGPSDCRRCPHPPSGPPANIVIVATFFQEPILGMGCNEALFKENKCFSQKGGVIQGMRGVVRTLKTEKLLSSSPSRKSSGTEKVPQRTFATKILPNFWVKFLEPFA